MEPMCWKCGKAITAENPVGRSLTCESCRSDLRSCRNCRFWSPGSYHDCAERIEDAPGDKERANFCDSFSVNPAFRKDHPGAGKNGNGPAAAPDPAAQKPDAGVSAARSAFDGLFG